MREALISILALLAVAPLARTSEVGKDGFNLYKGIVSFVFLLVFVAYYGWILWRLDLYSHIESNIR